MALSAIGWLDGSTALAVVLAGLIVGAISIFKGIKLRATLLTITGVAIICVGFVLLGPAMDFLLILMTENNLEPYWLYGLISYIWTGPVTIFGLYIGAELMMPKRKWIIVSIYGVLGIFFEVILFNFSFTDPSLIFRYPDPLPNGTALLNTSVVPSSLVFILMITFLVSGLIFNGFGFLRKALKASGEIKQKFYFLSFGWILFILSGALDALTDPGIITFFIRIGAIISIIFMYLGVRTK